jgi:UDP-3-O-[3-hydroxymyristoyl] glucosamine N-acyltransferase
MPTLSDIARVLNLPAPSANADVEITGVAGIEDARPGQITYVTSDKYLSELPGSQASAAVVNRKAKLPPDWESRSLRVDDPELAMGKVLALFAPPIPRPPLGIDPTAKVAASAIIGKDVAIGAMVVIGERTTIGAGSVIHPGVCISADVAMGEQCELHSNVVIRERITIGNRVIIHAGSVVGTDGFGYRWDGKQHQKTPQIGVVIIEDDVEIGSCVCIDRAKFGATRIGHGAKIDNLVQIAHNVQIGPHCILAGQAALAGSAQLGAGVVLGGQTAVRDHVHMGNGAMAAACSGVAEDVDNNTIVSGTPALPHRQSLREQAALRRLPHLVVQVRQLQEMVEALQKKLSP